MARSEILYSASLDEALRSEDPQARYAEACGRLAETVRATSARPANASVVYPGLYGVLRTPDQVIEDLLAIEGELLAGAAA